MLISQAIILNSQAANWRFKISFKKFKISKFKKFVKELANQHQIYVLIYTDVLTTREKFESKSLIFEKLLKFRDQFNNEKVEILFKQNQNDHVINLIKS